MIVIRVFLFLSLVRRYRRIIVVGSDVVVNEYVFDFVQRHIIQLALMNMFPMLIVCWSVIGVISARPNGYFLY